MARLLISDVAKRAEVSTPTIRYYEEIGVLAPPPRGSSGYRHYSDSAAAELRFIKKAQALGFSLDEIKEILKLGRSGKMPSGRVLELAKRHLAAIDERIVQLQKFKSQLAAEVAKWDGTKTPTCKDLCQIDSASEVIK
jgi:MerR family transcriptional regulator, copper efflux regulator